MDVQKQVIGVIAEALDIPEESVTLELSVGDIPEWNSIGNITLITKLEEVFGIEFQIERLFELVSVKDIIDEISMLYGK